jgi:hypothetical protein
MARVLFSQPTVTRMFQTVDFVGVELHAEVGAGTGGGRWHRWQLGRLWCRMGRLLALLAAPPAASSPPRQGQAGGADAAALAPQVADPSALLPEQLEAPLEALDKELGLLGNSLAKITQTKPLILSDFGYGGGMPNTNNTKPATTAAQVGSCPECGVLARYTK